MRWYRGKCRLYRTESKGGGGGRGEGGGGRWKEKEVRRKKVEKSEREGEVTMVSGTEPRLPGAIQDAAAAKSRGPYSGLGGAVHSCAGWGGARKARDWGGALRWTLRATNC